MTGLSVLYVEAGEANGTSDLSTLILEFFDFLAAFLADFFSAFAAIFKSFFILDMDQIPSHQLVLDNPAARSG